MSVERENAIINNTIILRCNFQYSQTGDYFDPSAIASVAILDSDGSTVLETLTGDSIVKDSTGKYHVVASAITSAKTIYDKWTFTPVSGASALTKTNTCNVWSTSYGAGTDLTSLTNLKAFLHISNTDDDTLLSEIITRITDKWTLDCNRILTSADYTEYYSGDGSDTLMLDQFPINSITSIYDDTDRSFGASTEISSDDIIFTANTNNAKSGIVKLDGTSFSKGVENIKITYNAGFTSVPNEIEQAVLQECSLEYRISQGAISAVEGQAEDPYVISIRRRINDVKDKYRRVR